MPNKYLNSLNYTVKQNYLNNDFFPVFLFILCDCHMLLSPDMKTQQNQSIKKKDVNVKTIHSHAKKCTLTCQWVLRPVSPGGGATSGPWGPPGTRNRSDLAWRWVRGGEKVTALSPL